MQAIRHARRLTALRGTATPLLVQSPDLRLFCSSAEYSRGCEQRDGREVGLHFGRDDYAAQTPPVSAYTSLFVPLPGARVSVMNEVPSGVELAPLASVSVMNVVPPLD